MVGQRPSLKCADREPILSVMKINKTVEGELTIFTVVGAVSAEEIVTMAAEDMAAPQTQDSMWDFSQASSVKLTGTAVKQIADNLTAHAAHIEGGKVALVGSGAIQVGLGKMFKAFATLAGLPYEYRVFRKRARAEAWLNGEID
jgi:hypothetical protein